MRKRPGVTTAAAVIVAVGAIAFSVRTGLPGPSSVSTRAYFTIDDGQHWFVDTMDHFPPFERDGKTASRLWLFSCDGGKTNFAGYLERFTPEAKKRLESGLAEFRSGKTQVPPSVGMGDSEVKKPGAEHPWVSRTNVQAASKITKVQCPAGGGDDAEIQMP